MQHKEELDQFQLNPKMKEIKTLLLNMAVYFYIHRQDKLSLLNKKDNYKKNLILTSIYYSVI
jgi:hypothetical protein